LRWLETGMLVWSIGVQNLSHWDILNLPFWSERFMCQF